MYPDLAPSNHGLIGAFGCNINKLQRTMAPKYWNIHLVGPTCVGKGWETDMLNENLKKSRSLALGIVCVGDLVRDRIEKDSEFSAKYKIPVSKGDLVADPDIIPMFDARLAEVSKQHSVRLDDGFCRTTQQVKHAEKLGLLGTNSVTFLLHASRSTCHRRALDRQARKKDGKRLDSDAFEKRFAFHLETIGKIHNALQNTGTRIIQVDADRDLQHEVIHDIVAGVEGLLGSHFEPTSEDLLQQASASLFLRRTQGANTFVAA